MKVLLISKSFPSNQFPTHGVFVKDFADQLNTQHEVTVLAPKPYSNLFLGRVSRKWKQIANIPHCYSNYPYPVLRPQFLSFPRRILYRYAGLLYWHSIKNRIDLRTPDVVHVNWIYPDGYIIKRIKKTNPKLPVVLTIHGSDWSTDQGNQSIFRHKEEALRAADVIITVGDGLKNDVLEHFPEFSNKVHSVANGLLIKGLKPSSALPRIGFHLSKRVKVLVVANYATVKGHSVLLDALEALIGGGFDDFEVVLVGNILNDEYYQQLLTRIQNSKLRNHVTPFSSTDRRVVYRLYTECSFCVLPSLKEGFGITLIEAIAFGKPVVSTRSGGPEQIVNSENGLLVDPNNSSELAKAILEMAGRFTEYNPDLIRDAIIRQYDYSLIIQKIEHLYEIAIQAS